MTEPAQPMPTAGDADADEVVDDRHPGTTPGIESVPEPTSVSGEEAKAAPTGNDTATKDIKETSIRHPAHSQSDDDPEPDRDKLRSDAVDALKQALDHLQRLQGRTKSTLADEVADILGRVLAEGIVSGSASGVTAPSSPRPDSPHNEGHP